MNDQSPEYNVADAFARPSRTQDLSSRLRKRSPAPAAEDPPEATRPAAARPDPSHEPPAEAPAPRQTPAAAPARRRSPRTAGPGSDGRLVVALPIPLRDRARAHASGRGETYLDVVLAAVQATHPQLPAALERHRAAAAPAEQTGGEAGGLFEHRPRPRRATEPTTQVTVRGLSAHDRGVLEQLVDDLGATSLTELITVALDEHLPQRPRSLR